MKNDASLFWERFDKIMKNSFSDLGDFCEFAEMSYNTVISQRTRKSMPKIEQLMIMASALHVSLNYLVTGQQIADPVLKSIDNNPAVKEIAHKLTMCDESKLAIVSAMLDSWVPD